MNYSVYDSSFSETKQSGRGMSANYLAWELSRHNLKECDISCSDVILVTCQSTESLPALETLRKRYKSKIIVVGGSASTSPYVLGKYSDMVCVGDGQLFLDVLFNRGIENAAKLSNVWVDGESREVEIDNNFPWDMPPIQAEDGAYRLWCGRGCKNKCKFCQTGWAYKYSENPNQERLIKQAKHLIADGKKIAYLSNDLSQHAFYKDLPKSNSGSYSLKYLKLNGLPKVRQVRLGIEGVSEKIRKSVSKPISNDDLMDSAVWLNNNGISVRWFLIAGLPDEKWDDWLELMDVVQKWKMLSLKGVLALSFTAFSPDPATPLAMVSINDDYWDYFSRFKEWFFGGKGWSNRVKLMSPQQPENRMQKSIRSLGLPENDIRRGGVISPNNRLRYPYKKLLTKPTP